MKGTFVFEVFRHFLFDGLEAGENVSVGVDDAFGLAGGAGSEDDLQGIGGGQVIDGGVGLRSEDGVEIGECERGQGEGGDLARIADDQERLNIGGDTGGEVERAGVVERDGDNAAQNAAKKGRDPFGAVFAPEENAVAFPDAAIFEFGGEAAG